ncbi:hypothetical protein CYMTET_13088 [Cymbomonas tetramitiformis]|uniref:Uncharacterized protein n=1 Tax=Cymbomonas tetramitiformis TaxID=36881 RepID=A0AAE0GJ13_9CHLO|nr:hypothetical protein CYMTET_13088 [Cymbomonas tetramitiformis]
MCSMKGNEVVIESEAAIANVEKLIRYTRNTVQRENIRNIVEALLEFDLYFPTLASVQAQVEERIAKQASEVIQQSPSASGLAEIDLGAREEALPKAEGAQNEAEKEEEDTWEEREEAASIPFPILAPLTTANTCEYDGFNVPTGQREVSLVNHEEEAEFDLASLQTPVDYSETVKNAETEIEGHDLENEDFLQTLKITRHNVQNIARFTGRELSEVRRQCEETLTRKHLDVGSLAVDGLSRKVDASGVAKTPFIKIQLKGEDEAAAILELGILLVDGQRFNITPKSSRC